MSSAREPHTPLNPRRLQAACEAVSSGRAGAASERAWGALAEHAPSQFPEAQATSTSTATMTFSLAIRLHLSRPSGTALADVDGFGTRSVAMVLLVLITES